MERPIDTSELDFTKFIGLEEGLVSAAVLDAQTGRYLMQGYMNRQAVERTLETGSVTFWSRDRKRLWMKGETSGNILKVARISMDCDRDALAIYAYPAGPTCHDGVESCFDQK